MRVTQGSLHDLALSDEQLVGGGFQDERVNKELLRKLPLRAGGINCRKTTTRRTSY